MEYSPLRRCGTPAALLILALGMAACESSTARLPRPEDRAHTIRTLVEVGPGTTNRVLRAGHTARVAAKVTDMLALPVVSAGVLWAAAAGSGAVIADSAATDIDGISHATWTLGTVSGLQELIATVAATTVVDRNTVLVYPDSVVGTLVAAAAGALARGDTTRVRLTDIRDQYGNAYTLNGVEPSNPPTVDFVSLTPGVATLVSTNARSALVMGVAPGTAFIVVSSAARADTVAITVTGP